MVTNRTSRDTRGLTSANASGAASPGATQLTLRRANLASVLKTILESPDPPSRADVATATGMTRSTVSRLVDDLVRGGVLAEQEPVATQKRGRPAVPLVAAEGTFVGVGLEVSLDFLAVRVLDLAGDVLAERVLPGEFIASDPVETLTRLTSLAADALAEPVAAGVTVVGAGLAVPGIVDEVSPRLLVAPNLGWLELDVPPIVAGPHAGWSLGNEADLAALCVGYEKPGRPGAHREFVYISGAVGVGASIHMGQTFRGANGWAGEVGHICVDPTGPLCRCGARGCLEQYVGRRALLDGAGLAADAPFDELVLALRNDEARAQKAITQAGRALGQVVSGVVNMLDIRTVILGGDLSVLGEFVIPQMYPELEVRVLSSRWAPTHVLTADLGTAPAATGAAYGALQALIDDPAGWIDSPAG
ncbi:MAG: ROK family transcriptional regulator [Dermatophilus congolensis]|nr:ROK family transcriptional regulator [Dermatophilus congolensis]